jgi:hypothetical protein
MLCPDGESFSSRRDDARGQFFKVDASAEDREHGLLYSPASGSRASVSGQIQEYGS